MNKKLPGIYHNDIKKSPNKQTFYSYNDNDIRNEKKFTSDMIIFNKVVIIETNTTSYVSRIVSKVDDHILTSDNDYILIKDIKNIKLKNRL